MVNGTSTRTLIFTSAVQRRYRTIRFILYNTIITERVVYYTVFIGYNLYYTERVVIFTRYHRSFFIITEQVVYYIRKESGGRTYDLVRASSPCRLTERLMIASYTRSSV